MYTYEISQWLLFFFIYCFLGWVWESSFVSVKSHHWVNRGFLHGPLLPIYGSGAIVVLFLTLPVRDNIPLIFLFGMIGATILEYVTGVLMEKLFGVRYWDYSNQFCNLNGHICLGCSLGWGAFSVLLVRVLHRPVEKLVLMLPLTVTQCVSTVVLIGFTVDFTVSFQAALDLKELLRNLRENNEELQRMQQRLDEVAAAFNSGKQELKEKVEARVEQGRERVELEKERLEERKERLVQSRGPEKEQNRERVLQGRERFEQALNRFAGKLEEEEKIYRERCKEEASEQDEKKERIRDDLRELKKRTMELLRRIPALTKRKRNGIRSLLKRNPGAVSVGFGSLLDELKREISEEKKNKKSAS